VCDVLGEPVLLSAEPETSARGAAILAFAAAGLIGDIADVPPPATTELVPDRERSAIHASALARHVERESHEARWRAMN